MYRDPSEFRERFKAYKDGKSVREIYGLPGYVGGKFDAATKKKIDYYYKLLRNNGFDMMSAIGILGNMMQESSFDPNVVNHLGYHGLLLNSKAIQNAIKNLYGDLSEQSQLRYLSDWTDGATWIRKGPGAKDTVLYSKSYLRNGYKTPELAAYEFLKRYERAIVVDKKTNIPLRDANGNYIYLDKDKRLGYAKSIYNYLSGRPDGIQELIALVGKTQPEPIIATQDATRVATIPTVQQQAIDYSDRRNSVVAEAERAMWAHNVMEDMKGAYQVPIWESPSLPALTPVEYDVTPMRYKNGKLPGYGGGKISMGAKRNLTEEELNTTLQNVLHEQGMSGEDPLMSMLVGMKAVRLVGDLLALRRLKERAEMYKRWREANELTRDASRAWKMLDADRMARSWGYSDNPLGFLYDVFLDPVANLYTKILKHPVLGPLIPFRDGKLPEYSDGKIRIKPANRGKFNATKKRTGKTTEELTHSKNPLTRKRAIFAQNAKKWNHK